MDKHRELAALLPKLTGEEKAQLLERAFILPGAGARGGHAPENQEQNHARDTQIQSHRANTTLQNPTLGYYKEAKKTRNKTVTK